MAKLTSALAAALSAAALASANADPATISYQLPTDGPLPRTYLVTLAATDPTNSEWIVSTILWGEPRTVTAENQGRFTEEWNGLDENFMPVPPGDYGVKGIYAPAAKWGVDNDWHAITARYAVGFSEYFPKPTDPENWKYPIPFQGDPVNAPLMDAYVAENGIASFYYQYLENGYQTPMFDLNHEEVEPAQFIRAFQSGGAGGGPLVCNDGETSWAVSDDSCHCIYRSDTQPFGSDNGPYRGGVTLIEGEAVGLDAWRNASAGASYVYATVGARYDGWTLTSERIDTLTAYTASGTVLGSCRLDHPRATAVRNGTLYALVRDPDSDNAGDCAVMSIDLASGGLPQGGSWNWTKLFSVPSDIANPARMTVDPSGRIYLSDPDANKVYQLTVTTKGKKTSVGITRTFGALSVQTQGAYDRNSFMRPFNLSSWRDGNGLDRLIVVELEGPNRVSEWNAATGALIREFPTYQTKANSGYGADPEDATHIYMPTHGDWITRFRVDYATGSWTPDAVWKLRVPEGLAPLLSNGYLNKTRVLRANGSLFIAGESSYEAWRLTDDGAAIVPSAALCRRGNDEYSWHDANGDGELQEGELAPLPAPGWVRTYHGQKWSGALQLLALCQNSRTGWRLAPSSFDAFGNPVFTQWEQTHADPVFEGLAANALDDAHGGNELATDYSSDWMQMDGSPESGYYVQARGGPGIDANRGAQYKISRYVPDGDGGMRLAWRVGRAYFAGSTRGAIVGAMRIFDAINGIVPVIDQTRSGVHLYTDDGLYVDTLFPGDWYREEIGVYRQPGEFFVGTVYTDTDTGSIYYAGGKFTPIIYEAENWSLTENPVRHFAASDFGSATVHLDAAQIADPPEFALNFRGGAGSARVMRFLPALGTVALDGSMSGWEDASAATYDSPAGQHVEARGLYAPDTLYVRWQVTLRPDETFSAKPLPGDISRMFTHDAGADTVSIYLQGDSGAAAPSGPDGRPGDVRIVCGIFSDDGALRPVALGLYPDWDGPNANPQSYHSPVYGNVSFENVDLVAGARLGCSVADDGRSFVIAAAFPRSAFPAITSPFSDALRLRVDFDANLGGHNKFWWANIDGFASIETYDEPSEVRFYPGAWAPATFGGLADGIPVRSWFCIGPFGGPGCEEFTYDCSPAQKDPCIALLSPREYPPDGGNVDTNAVYSGEVVQGYWDDPGRIVWRQRAIEPLDSRVSLGTSAQVWYAVTWIYAPVAMSVEARYLTSFQSTSRWWVNGESVDGLQYRELEQNDFIGGACNEAVATLSLKAGWNQVMGRTFCVGYPPVKIGLRLHGIGDEGDADLWRLSFSPVPPAAEPEKKGVMLLLW